MQKCQLFHRPQPSIVFREWKLQNRSREVVGFDFMVMNKGRLGGELLSVNENRFADKTR